MPLQCLLLALCGTHSSIRLFLNLVTTVDKPPLIGNLMATALTLVRRSSDVARHVTSHFEDNVYGFATFELELIVGKFVLRRLSASDAATFKKIRLQALFEHPQAFGASWEEESDQPESRIAERLESGHVIAGISEEGTIVGTIGILRSKGQKTQHIASIWGMYVSPVARGDGLGRRLLDAAVAEAGSSAKSVRLRVEAKNEPAIKLYESAGFKRWALEVDALKVGDVFHDEILMRLDIG